MKKLLIVLAVICFALPLFAAGEGTGSASWTGKTVYKSQDKVDWNIVYTAGSTRFEGGYVYVTKPAGWGNWQGSSPNQANYVSAAVVNGSGMTITVKTDHVAIYVASLNQLSGKITVTFSDLVAGTTAGNNYFWVYSDPDGGLNQVKIATNPYIIVSSTAATNTPTITNTPVPTSTVTLTYTRTFTPTITNTHTRTYTQTLTPTETFDTPTLTETPTETDTGTETMTLTITPTLTETLTPTLTHTLTHTVTKTVTNTPTVTQTPTVTKTPTPTITAGYAMPLDANGNPYNIPIVNTTPIVVVASDTTTVGARQVATWTVNVNAIPTVQAQQNGQWDVNIFNSDGRDINQNNPLTVTVKDIQTPVVVLPRVNNQPALATTVGSFDLPAVSLANTAGDEIGTSAKPVTVMAKITNSSGTVVDFFGASTAAIYHSDGTAINSSKPFQVTGTVEAKAVLYGVTGVPLAYNGSNQLMVAATVGDLSSNSILAQVSGLPAEIWASTTKTAANSDILVNAYKGVSIVASGDLSVYNKANTSYFLTWGDAKALTINPTAGTSFVIKSINITEDIASALYMKVSLTAVNLLRFKTGIGGYDINYKAPLNTPIVFYSNTSPTAGESFGIVEIREE